jgi:hypothetical protein
MITYFVIIPCLFSFLVVLWLLLLGSRCYLCGHKRGRLTYGRYLLCRECYEKMERSIR